jgi:hypothetical protein
MTDLCVVKSNRSLSTITAAILCVSASSAVNAVRADGGLAGYVAELANRWT